MAHLTLQHSPSLAPKYDFNTLCDQLRRVMVDQGCFPVGGIRVRAWPTPAEALADGDPTNAYVDMVLRMGAGRDQSTKTQAGQALMAAAQAFFASEMQGGHFMLALEIMEIDPDLSWKINTVHARLKGAT